MESVLARRRTSSLFDFGLGVWPPVNSYFVLFVGGIQRGLGRNESGGVGIFLLLSLPFLGNWDGRTY